MNVFPNLNTRSDISRLVGGSGKPLWGAGMHSVLETGMSRRALHIADWDGDGRADVIGVNNDDFSVTVWKNNWNGNSFDFQRQQIEGGPFCTIKRGLGYDDQSVHVVDIRCVALWRRPQARNTTNQARNPVARARQTSYAWNAMAERRHGSTTTTVTCGSSGRSNRALT